MRLIALVLAALAGAQCLAAEPGTVPDWIIASADGRAFAGERFELVVIAPQGETPPEELQARLTVGRAERVLTLTAVGVPGAAQRVYAADMPVNLAGPVSVELVGRTSSVLSLLVAGKPDTLHALTGAYGDPRVEPPLSENDPMYFVVGARDGWNARFQLSFKFRLFDQASGFGKDQPWLSGLYFGYTQNSLWEIDSDSQQLRDTSYRPSLFWRWERADDKTWIDGLRAGVEHESNGKDGDRSRSVNTLFVRPEWRWKLPDGGSFEFTPKIYGYLDKEENPDILDYNVRRPSQFRIGFAIVP